MELTVEKLQSVVLKKGEILIITFDPDELSESELTESHETCKRIFPENKVIFVPKHIEISVMKNPDSIPIGG